MKALYLPSERAFFRYIEIPGEGPPLVWLHGWQCSSTGELMAAAVQPSLRGRRSLLVDFLGHGYSDRPAEFGYTGEDHARTVEALIDELGLRQCILVGHSMGGGVAVRVAAARQDVVTLLVMAEAAIDPGGGTFGGQTEAEFVARGFDELLETQSRDAEANPLAIVAAHAGITRTNDARAIWREGHSLGRGGEPPIRELLAGLGMPRWYLQGEASGPESGLRRDLAAIGVGWRVVPQTGHAMGLQNPVGLAAVIAALL